MNEPTEPTMTPTQECFINLTSEVVKRRALAMYTAIIEQGQKMGTPIEHEQALLGVVTTIINPLMSLDFDTDKAETMLEAFGFGLVLSAEHPKLAGAIAEFIATTGNKFKLIQLQTNILQSVVDELTES